VRSPPTPPSCCGYWPCNLPPPTPHSGASLPFPPLEPRADRPACSTPLPLRRKLLLPDPSIGPQPTPLFPKNPGAPHSSLTQEASTSPSDDFDVPVTIEHHLLTQNSHRPTVLFRFSLSPQKRQTNCSFARSPHPKVRRDSLKEVDGGILGPAQVIGTARPVTDGSPYASPDPFARSRARILPV